MLHQTFLGYFKKKMSIMCLQFRYFKNDQLTKTNIEPDLKYYRTVLTVFCTHCTLGSISNEYSPFLYFRALFRRQAAMKGIVSKTH